VHREYLSTAPRRKILGDIPVINIDGYDRTCMDCHKLFPARDAAPEALLQHKNILLDHGINDRCRNCHDVKDRNRLVMASGDSISYGEVVLLCAKCHGPIYRDWEHGMHGRTNGYWDSKRGKQRRLSCIECHDPHSPRIPAMDPLAPLPPPKTLRMGEPGEHDPEKTDPLRRSLKISAEAAAGVESGKGEDTIR